MRTLRLAKVAAQAEVLRYREMAKRQVRRVVFAIVATIFLIGFLIAGHIAIAMALVPMVTPLQSVLIVGGGDLVLAVTLLMIAAISKPGRIEREATEMGLQVREELRQSMTVPALMGGAARSIGMDNVARLVWSIVSGRMFRRRKG